MPDFGAILRKAREGAVLHGAAGASGATSGKPCSINARAMENRGPIVEIGVGPLGPTVDRGPTGPEAFRTLGPACPSEEGPRKQDVNDAGPSGPTGPSEKQHVRKNTAPLAGHALLPDTPQGWRDGLARLDRWIPPCGGFRVGEWEAVHRAVAHFMDHYAAEAARRGWTALDLFGVHGLAGAARVDSCGALMLPLLRNATALTADAITFGSLTYRRRAMPEAVLAWNFAGGTWREGEA